ncbi:copper amine oxidase N-terminal domain-containing protein [Sporanaerobacter sp. PP17-6a]|uniref:copper amine oxidase N-terminal domain-containing protein n=1 Tax=Sporanaerobacter sp. PP17-6a TaxID=1891289 RepID=UPI0008A00048|nr:copper amine oxidase N-terminal domain-containing protein [Sporanaerobacter sp. PP17-6a]SCL81217.1 tRNA(1-methyladenosine) methyltransferase [Sporanaerobacter sp. PP17-6a]
MKKLSLVLAFILIFASFGFAESDIKLFYNGSEIKIDEPILNENGKVLVPMKGLFEALGAKVKWDSASREILISQKDKLVELKIDSKNAYVNNSLRTLDTAPKIINDITYIPTRFIAESLDMDVYWNDYSRGIYINSGFEEKYDSSNTFVEYRGQFLNGKPNGFARKYGTDGNLLYEGYFVNGHKNGIGTQYWSNGDKYIGNFISDSIAGKGKLIYKGNGTYIGEFLNGVRSGEGIFSWPNGERYEGSWLKDKMNGNGTYIFKNKDKYVGQWLDNYMDGEGIYYFANGKAFKGTWQHGVNKGGSMID